MRDRVKDSLWRPPFGWRSSTHLDLLLALLLSGFAEVIVSGRDFAGDPRGGAPALAAVLLMTLPVAVRILSARSGPSRPARCSTRS
jgi:hypothetical protein